MNEPQYRIRSTSIATGGSCLSHERYPKAQAQMIADNLNIQDKDITAYEIEFVRSLQGGKRMSEESPPANQALIISRHNAETAISSLLLTFQMRHNVRVRKIRIQHHGAAYYEDALPDIYIMWDDEEKTE